MKSQGILSRYVRPGYRFGGQAYKNLQEKRKNWKKDRSFFFREDIEGGDTIKSGKEPKYGLGVWNEKEQTYDFIDGSNFDPEKIKTQDQVIFSYNPEDENYYGVDIFDEEKGGMSQVPNYMLHETPQAYDKARVKQKFQDVKDTAVAMGQIVKGKELKDDVLWGDTLKEYGKATGRTFLGAAKIAPEMAAMSYRFLNPIEKLGGVGPIDTFKKHSEGDYTLEDEYYLPGYSELFGKEHAGKGVFPEWLKADESLYEEDNEFDKVLQEEAGFDRDDVNEQLGAMVLGNVGPGILSLSGPARNAAKLARMKELYNTINRSKKLRAMDNPMSHIGAGITGDLMQSQINQ